MCIFAVIDSAFGTVGIVLKFGGVTLSSGEFVLSISCTILTFERQSL